MDQRAPYNIIGINGLGGQLAPLVPPVSSGAQAGHIGHATTGFGHVQEDTTKAVTVAVKCLYRVQLRASRCKRKTFVLPSSKLLVAGSNPVSRSTPYHAVLRQATQKHQLSSPCQRRDFRLSYALVAWFTPCLGSHRVPNGFPLRFPARFTAWLPVGLSPLFPEAREPSGNPPGTRRGKEGGGAWQRGSPSGSSTA
jgi:hypothetical protein